MKTVRSIVLWNQAIAKAKPDLVVKVEEAEMVCYDWIKSLGLEIHPRPGFPLPAKNVNHRTSGGWDLDGTVPWKELNKEYLQMFQEHCKEYGYDDTPPSK